MSDVAERLNRLETDLNDCTEVAENVAVDAGAGNPNSDVPHRASVLATALRAVTQDVKDLRAQVDKS
mgnify:CR=1 FL=1